MEKIIKYIPSDSTIIAPHRGSDRAAAWDMHAAQDVELRPYEYVRIPAGIRAELPEGYVLLILPRSGFSFKNQIIAPNAVGVIDEDFRGDMWITACWQPNPIEALQAELGQIMKAGCMQQTVTLKTNPNLTFKVQKGDRIAQALLVKYEEQHWEKVNELTVTARGDGGFGSTGIRTERPVPPNA